MMTIKNSLLALVAVLSFSVFFEASAALPETPSQQPATKAVRQSALTKILRAAKDVSWIAEGNGPRLIYIFFDPNCPYCHKLYQESRTWVSRDGLQLRWIPVGILMPSSAGKAVAILEAKDPLVAFRENEDKFGSAPKFGGIAETSPSLATGKRLQQNTMLFKQTGMPGVPVILFREASGSVRIVEGTPSPRLLDEMWRSVR